MSTLQCTLHWIMRYIGPPKVIFKGNMQTLLSQIRSDQLISTYTSTLLVDLKCDTLSEFYRSYWINNQYFLDNFDSRKVIKIWENYRSCGLIVQTRVALKRKWKKNSTNREVVVRVKTRYFFVSGMLLSWYMQIDSPDFPLLVVAVKLYQ